MKIAKKFTDLFSDALWTIDTAGARQHTAGLSAS